jgi:hypothetical protein
MQDEKRQAIEENYINGNMTDAAAIFQKLRLTDRKEYAINALYDCYSVPAELSNIKAEKYEFAAFLIEHL